MITRKVAHMTFGISGFSILAGNAITYWSRGDYELIAVQTGLAFCLIAICLLEKKKKKKHL